MISFAFEAYPTTATLIPWSDRANLQSYLDSDSALVQPKGCRLEPGKDYVAYSGGPSSITVRNNTKLYAINSRICQVNIPAGTTDVYLSGLTEGTITFQSGTTSQVTKRVTLNRVHYITQWCPKIGLQSGIGAGQGRQESDKGKRAEEVGT